MQRRHFLILPAIALLFGGAANGGEPAPRIRTHLREPLPAPYDARVDAKAAVAAAFARAKAEGRPLLIDFGANWCADCRVLAGALELPEIHEYIGRNFELVQVDIGKFDRNLDIPQQFGLKKLSAVPAVLVIDSETGQLRNPRNVLALGDARTMTPQQIANWLARWTK